MVVRAWEGQKEKKIFFEKSDFFDFKRPSPRSPVRSCNPPAGRQARRSQMVNVTHSGSERPIWDVPPGNKVVHKGVIEKVWGVWGQSGDLIFCHCWGRRGAPANPLSPRTEGAGMGGGSSFFLRFCSKNTPHGFMGVDRGFLG
jgi:hypothetical protein